MNPKNHKYLILLIIILFFPKVSFAELDFGTRKEVINKGVSYLVFHQGENGSWEHSRYPTAITALAGLSILGAGHMPERGQYSHTLRKIIDLFIFSQRKRDGRIAFQGEDRSMYGHGFATLFLSQVYGMTPDKKIKEALQSAVEFIVKTQNKKGGWWYEPYTNDDEGTVTIVQIQALRAARDTGIFVPKETIERDTGIFVPKETIEKAIDYVKKSQYPNGGIAYGTGPSGNATAALTAAGLLVLLNGGKYEMTESHQKGFKYLDENMDKLFEKGNFMYQNFYAAQVYHFRGEPYRESYFSKIEPLLIREIKTEGNGYFWDKEEGSFYSTAMALLILEIPLGILPIFVE